MAERPRARQPAHDLRPEAQPPVRRIDGERAEHERGAARAGRHVPQAHGGDDGAVMLDDQRQAVRGATALAQALAGLLETRCAEANVEHRLARPRVTEGFFSDFEHGRVPPEQGSDGPRTGSTGAGRPGPTFR